MPDMRLDLPKWAFMNAQILQNADAAGDLARAVAVVESAYGVPRGTLRIRNLAYLVSLLYCLIVVPKELWPIEGKQPSKRPPTLRFPDHTFLAAIEWNTKPTYFSDGPVSGEIVDDDDRVFYFVYHLRNALSHANFAITPSQGFRFWDPKDSGDVPKRRFDATMSLAVVEHFLATVGAVLANTRPAI
jgi:hypothetical protein